MDIGTRLRFRDPLPQDLTAIAGPDHAVLLPRLAAAINGEVGTAMEIPTPDRVTIYWASYGGGYVGPDLPQAVFEVVP